MRRRLVLACCVILWAAACAPTATPETAAPTLVDVYATSVAEAWLAEAFSCADGVDVVLSVTPDPGAADLALRVGEPAALTSPAFQIDSEEILVVAHRASPLQSLTLERVRDLFAGRGDPSVQVWVYPSEADIQKAFDQLVMAGGSVSSFARVASTPQEMSDALNAESNALGILPRHGLAGSMHEIYSVGSVPVLAIVRAEPQGALKSLIACLQK